jgi:hypothetical protein
MHISNTSPIIGIGDVIEESWRGTRVKLEEI